MAKTNTLHVDYDELVLTRGDRSDAHAHTELVVPEGAEIRILGVTPGTDHVVQYLTYRNVESDDEDA